jgi:hypothetical protein
MARDRGHVGGLPCIDVAVDELTELRVVERTQRSLLALSWKSFLDGLVCPLQRAVDRARLRVEDVGGLAGRKAEDVAQDQHRALACRQVLERGDERKLDALTLLVASLRAGRVVLHEEMLVRGGLDPHRLQDRLGRPVARIRGRAVVDRKHALGPALDRFERRVRGDRVEPRAQRAALLEPWQPSPRAEERVLERVLGVGGRAEHPVRVRVELAAKRGDEASEGVLVSPLGGREKVALAHRHAFCCHNAISAPAGADTTLRHPAGPSHGSSETDAPSRRARSVASSIRSTST